MPMYDTSFGLSNRRRKSRKGLKIFLGIVAVLVIALGIFFALHYKALLLAFGGGNLEINRAQSIGKSMAASGDFQNVKTGTDASGNTTVTGVSKDGAVSYSVTQQKSGKETVTAQVNLKKLDTHGISKSAVLHGDTAAIQKAKAQMDAYLVPIVGQDQATGIETYLAKQALQQSKSNPNSIRIAHTFGKTTVQVSGSLSAHSATVKVTQ